MKYKLIKEEGKVPIHLLAERGEFCKVFLVFRTGSFYEDDKTRGISHLLEHLVFCANEMGQQKMSQAFTDCGAAVNAATSTDYVEFHFTSLPEYITQLTKTYMSALQSFKVTQELLDKEVGVVIQELKDRLDNNWVVAWETFTSSIFKQHPIKYPIVGYEDVLRSLTPDQVNGWFHDHFTSNNMEAVISFPEAELPEDLVYSIQNFKLNNDIVPELLNLTEEQGQPVFQKTRTPFQGWQQNILMYGYKIPRDNPAEEFVCQQLTGSMSTFLWRALREEASIAYALGSYPTSLDSNGSILYVNVSYNNPTKEGYLLQKVQEAFTKLSEISEPEFEVLKRQILTNTLISIERTATILSHMVHAVVFKDNPDPQVYIDSFKNLTHQDYLDFLKNFTTSQPFYAIMEAQRQ